MNTKLSKKDDISSLTQEKLDIDKLKTLLEMFNFNIPEEQLQYIQINSLTKWRFSFTNNFTKETCFAYYTSICPSYDGNCTSYDGENERFLGQKIQSNSVIKMNWFYVQGERYHYDDFTIEPTYIPPYNRNRVAIIEEAIFNGKNSDGEFVLHIQKDHPHSDNKKNFEVQIFKGNFDEVYPIQLGDVLEPDYSKQIVRIKYGLNQDYNYFETGCSRNWEKLNETRYIYGRNMSSLTDYEFRRNSLVDNRLVYGVDHKDDVIRYHGVISEDGTNSFERIRPIGMGYLSSPLQLLENNKEKLISKIYFQGYDKTTGHKSLGILKTKNGISIIRDEMQYDRSEDFRRRVGYQRIGEYSLPETSEGTITIAEIQSAINILRDNIIDDTFIKSICNELEMFIERKIERTELSKEEFQVSDICIPNLAVHFDTDLIIDMILKQGISKILKSYSDMFRSDKQTVINCNRENDDLKSK